MTIPMTVGVFLDRDGVLCENREGHVLSWADWRWLPGALEAVATLYQAGLSVVVVTNQPALGEGLLGEAELSHIHARMASEVEAAGGYLDGVYVCPHGKAEGCGCRKPLPGLIVRASRYLGIDRAASYLVGDSTTDVEAGIAAGLRRCYLTLTGRYDGRDLSAYAGRLWVVENVADAARCILSDEGIGRG